MCALTAAGLHANLQAQVVDRAHHPQVARGSDVKLQPALLSRPQPSSVQQEEVCLPARTLSINHNNFSTSIHCSMHKVVQT